MSTFMDAPVAEEVLQKLQEELSAAILQPWLPEEAAHPLGRDVVGIGIGPKYVGGKATEEPAIVFFVRRKRPRRNVEHLIPERIDGVLTDVEQSGDAVAFQQAPAAHRQKLRPFKPGGSIGTGNGATTGTFGAVVFDGFGEPYLLGSNHVLADFDRCRVGQEIIQPGSLDEGNAADDVVGHLYRAVPLDRAAPNEVDCAIARPIGDRLDPEILYIGRPEGIGVPTLGMPVHKTGRATGYTTGFVRTVSTDYDLLYGGTICKLKRQTLFKGDDDRPFSGEGDSGALILDRRNNVAVAQLNGGTAQYSGPTHVTLGSGIAAVLSTFGVRLT